MRNPKKWKPPEHSPAAEDARRFITGGGNLPEMGKKKGNRIMYYLIKYRYTRRRSWNCDRILTKEEYTAEMELNRKSGHKIRECGKTALVTIEY